jgi:hypothetical protein
VTVAKDEPVLFNVVGYTEACDCQWTAEIPYTFEGKNRKLTIDDGGKPFRTSANTKAIRHYWDGNQWALWTG